MMQEEEPSSEGLPEELRAGAEAGDPDSQVRLGMMYFAGAEGLPEDKVEGARWYRRAADQGHATGQYGLGLSYLIGKGVDKDVNEGLRWLRLSARQGFQLAKDRLDELGRSEEEPVELGWPLLALVIVGILIYLMLA
jgi:TPR repeat protein